MNKNISGIYAIVNNSNLKRYIGSSKSVHYRWKQNHLPQLKNGTHPNRHLRSAWLKYGEEAFTFQILEECEETVLLEREGYWIEHYKSWEREYGYNFTRIVDQKQVFSQESKNLMQQSKQQKDYWITGKNAEILRLFKDGNSKNSIAVQLGITRSEVYSCLTQNGLYEKSGKGTEIKFTEEVKLQVAELRSQGASWRSIFEKTEISKTQAYRTKIAGGDEQYASNNVNRKTYRTVTPEVIAKVAILRQTGKTWCEIEKELKVSRFALHQNGITAQYDACRKGRTPRKITEEDRQKILELSSNGMIIKKIALTTGIAESTVRLQIKKAKCV